MVLHVKLVATQSLLSPGRNQTKMFSLTAPRWQLSNTVDPLSFNVRPPRFVIYFQCKIRRLYAMRAKSYDTNAPQGRNPVCIVPTRNFTLFWFSRQWQVAIGNAVTRLALRHQWQHCVGGAAAVLLLCAGYQCCVGGVVQMTRCPVPVVFNDQF